MLEMNNQKSVGILTFLHTLNYGAIFQAYALEKVLQMAGFNAIQLDYRNPKVEAFEFKHATTMKGYLANLVRRPIIQKKEKLFDKFRRQYILSTPPLSRDDLVKMCKKFDYILVGSDQVWNGLVTGFDATYFLDFINDPEKKKTYAVSIGQDKLPISQDFDYAHFIKDFSCILIREKTAAKTLQPLCVGKRFETVLDPTFLLNRNEWLNMSADGRTTPRNPYVFVYAVGETKTTVTAAKKIAKRRGLDVIVLQQNGFLPISGVTNLFSISPSEFLSYIANAELVVTSSFHGTCLSIILERDFLVSYATNTVKRNSRMSDLLESLDLSGRTLQTFSPANQSVDWVSTREHLSAMRAESLNLLFDSLGGAVNR